MSLSLRESCNMYERHCRRHNDVPSFEEFNREHFTCLPNNPTAHARFLASVSSARKAEGIPVRRKLFSLYKCFDSEENTDIAFKTTGAVVDIKRLQRACPVAVPTINRAVRMNTRQPEATTSTALTSEETSEMDESDAVESAEWTLESYKDALSCATNPKLKDKSNNMVHFVPTEQNEELASLACKLTKSTWDTLTGKTSALLKMRDGTKRNMQEIVMNETDFAELRQKRKGKVPGPYFIRVSSI